jgi:Tfp pilus assembly protein PilP
MNKFYTIIATVLMAFSTFAQAPEKMSYQAVIRDVAGNLVTNQSVGMQISILQTTASGTAVYVETQTPTTNINGLVSTEIGNGAVITGTFSAIDWSIGTYFIKTETDPTGGSTYSITGTSQLLSVPYALHAKTASSVLETQTLANVLVLGNIANNQLKNVTDPTDAQDAATKAYIDALIAGFEIRIQALENPPIPSVPGIYWKEKANDGTNIEYIVRTNLDGTNKQNIVTSGAYAVQNFGSNMQVTATKIFWVEKANDGTSIEYIVRTNLDGTNKQNIVTSGAYAVQNFGSNMQVTATKIFWVEKANDGTNIEYIVRTNLDGTNKQNIVTSGAYAVQNFGSNMQVTDANIFWVEKANDGTNIDYIVRTNLDGTNKQTIVTSGSFAVQNFGSNMQVTDTNIFWVEKANDGTNIEYIVRTNLDGTNKQTIVTSGSFAVQNFGSNMQVTQ